MNLLLDTHTFLWLLFSPEKISKSALRVMEDAENQLFLSTVSFWEISLKYCLKKLELNNVKPEEMVALAEEMNINIITLEPDESSSYYRLNLENHKDPFDRMLIWQAIKRNLVLVTKDKEMINYKSIGLKVFW